MLFFFYSKHTMHSIKSNNTFQALLDKYHEGKLSFEPVNATYAGDHRFDHLFANSISKEYKNNLKEFLLGIKKELSEFDKTAMNRNDQMSHEILNYECDIQLEGLAFPLELTPIDQTWSINHVVGQFASGESAQAFNTTEDYDRWLERVDQYLVWCETAIENMRQGISSGIVQPTSLIKKVIPQFAELAEGDFEAHLFYKPALNIPSNISDQNKGLIRKRFEKMVEDKIKPMYRRMTSFLQNEYLPKGRKTSGIGAYKHGADMYQYMIKLNTNSSMSADEIHQIGLREVTRLRNEMEKVKDSLDYKGDLSSFFDFIRSYEVLMPFEEPQEVIEHFNAIYQRILPKLNQLFDLQPKAAFEVRRTESFREATTSPEYFPPSIDGSRPGIFYVPIPDVHKYNILYDEDLFLHEAIPGHHYQISLQQENQNLPAFRKSIWYTAYGEGWALYCESLGEELGLYKDPFQYFGMLSQEIHRAIRLVVDTGLHAKGWTREQAIQYSLENEAESVENIVSEIERYMAMPGQALSYKIGQLKIIGLREKAEREMNGNFDIKQFHNIILESGCVPLQLLEKNINTWIDHEKIKMKG